MNSNTLARVLRALRMTQDQPPDGQILAAMNRANAILAAEGLDWTDLLGGDPDAPDYPKPPIWHSSSGLFEEEMQNLFDAGYQRGYTDGKDEQAQTIREAEQFISRRKADDWLNLKVGEPSTSIDLEDLINRTKNPKVKLISFSEFHRKFIESYHERFARYGTSTSISPKQAIIWQEIDKRLRRHGL